MWSKLIRVLAVSIQLKSNLKLFAREFFGIRMHMNNHRRLAGMLFNSGMAKHLCTSALQ